MFGKKRKLDFKRTAIALAALVIVVGGTVTIYTKRLNSQRAQYQAIIADKDAQLQKYTLSSRKGYILAKSVTAGQVLQDSDVMLADLPDITSPTDVIANKDDVVGKMIKVAGTVNMPITTDMVYSDGKLDPTARKLEIDYIRLPIQLTINDYIDIRIVFPNGEDYRVLSKVRMTGLDLNNQILYMNGTTEDIHLLDSALVDAYLNDAEIYAVQYVDGPFQDAAIKDYLPRIDVLNRIKSDPTITDRARYSVAAELRKGLDERLAAIPDNEKHRIGADLPDGSAVSKRKKTLGASVVVSGNGATQTTGNASGVTTGVGTTTPNTTTNPPATSSTATTPPPVQPQSSPNTSTNPNVPPASPATGGIGAE